MSCILSSKQYNLYRDDSQGLQAYDGRSVNINDLIRIHHAGYLDDIPFWISRTENCEPILEVGCGHGRVTLPLLAEGRKIVGVDIDLAAIRSLREVLGEKDLELQKNAQIVHQDIINFKPEYSFGVVIIPCNTYSTFPPEERQIIISKIYQLLGQRGVFAVSMPNPIQLRYLHEKLQENADQFGSDLETSYLHPDTGNPVQVSSSMIAKEMSLGWDWIYDHLHPDGQVDRFVKSTEHFLATLKTYQQELIAAGFAEIVSMGNFDNSDYTEDSPYLILVGRKLDS